MRAAMDVITSGDRSSLTRPVLLNIIYDMFKGAPYGFLIMVLWTLFAPEIDYGHLFVLIGGMVVTYVIQYFLGVNALVSVFQSGYSLCSEGRLNLGEHLRRLPMGFFKGRDPGDITSLMLQDMAMVENIFTHLIADIIAAFTIPALLAVFMLVMDWKLTVVVFLTVLLSLPFLYISRWLIYRCGLTLTDARVESGSRLLEYLQGIRYIKAYNLTGKRFVTLKKALQDLHRAAIRVEVIPGSIASCYMSLLGVAYVVVVLAAMYALLGGTLTVPVFLVFLVLGHQFYQPLVQAGMFIMEARFMNLAAERMKTVMNEQPLPEPAVPASPDGYRVVFNHVSFGYHERDVLTDVSFSVSPGEVLALVGPSGSGKTTITSLIARFWDVRSGSITLGDVDIRSIGTEQLLSSLSMVFQDVYLFNDTIRNNIRIGRAGATDEEIMAAARQAMAHGFIAELPDGYDTIIGEGGSTLSGGEKQRISIARALLKDAPIILLDEATASLDPENEQAIQEAISALIRNKTVVVIAHRLNTIQDADRIVVLDQGRVVETGIHDELLKAAGTYARMWQEQQKAAEWTVSSGNGEKGSA